jgi:hypothetical protein
MVRIFTMLKLIIKVMSDYRFNRQELFTREDMRELMDIISDVELHRDDFDGRYQYKNDTVVNQLYGMFDGVLYDNVIHNSNTAMLPTALVGRISRLIDMIVKHILTEKGEQVEEYSFDKVWIP